MKSFPVVLVCLVLVASPCEAADSSPSTGPEPDPVETAMRSMETAMGYREDPSMWRWSYGPGIMLDAMLEWEIMAEALQARRLRGAPAFPSLKRFVDLVLDDFLKSNSSYAWKVLHGVSLPWGSAPGDEVGLFPISYLHRAELEGTGLGGDDGRLADTVARLYVLPWPHRLPDGTLARVFGWQGEPSSDLTLWGDDQFMGLTLAARLARAGAPNASEYLDFAVKQALSFGARMADREGTFPAPLGTGDGLFFHGVDGTTGRPSCCKWGRANGWGMMAHAEVMAAIEEVRPDHPSRADVLSMYTDHATAMASFQSADGRWHQVVNETSTYLETSVTAMTVFSIATGITQGWLDKHTFQGVIDKAWPSLAAQVQPDGTVSGICMGTGIETSVAQYEKRPTAYNVSQPGLGSVWRAALAVHKLEG